MCTRLVLLAGVVAAPLAAADPPAGLKLLYAQDFSKPEAMKDFAFTDPKAWRLGTTGSKPFLEQHAGSKYTPSHRSPFNFALIAGKRFGDFVLDVELQSTAREYGHRDMVLVFGYQSPSQFYYAHIASQGDDHANNVFIVKDAPRVKIAKETNKGNDWGKDAWRTVRLERTLETGAIKVYFGDLKKPVMVAEDRSFGLGWVGFGTFDDTGRVANVKVWGKEAEEKRVAGFGKE
ncbi:MAG TPA: hypothetical protein VM597_17525 [Gemmataceae bacterium]|jgi:hypothetical protein|nr:hypothetical protein [Gemmataceae bacterium]